MAAQNGPEFNMCKSIRAIVLPAAWIKAMRVTKREAQNSVLRYLLKGTVQKPPQLSF